MPFKVAELCGGKESTIERTFFNIKTDSIECSIGWCKEGACSCRHCPVTHQPCFLNGCKKCSHIRLRHYQTNSTLKSRRIGKCGIDHVNDAITGNYIFSYKTGIGQRWYQFT